MATNLGGAPPDVVCMLLGWYPRPFGERSTEGWHRRMMTYAWSVRMSGGDYSVFALWIFARR